MIRFWQVLIIAVFLLSGAAYGQDDDLIINRPMRVAPQQMDNLGDGSIAFTQSGRPSDFIPRDFPSVISDPRLPNEPDGILWRRLLKKHPDLKPIDLLTQSPDEMRAYLAKASEQAFEPQTVNILVMRVDFLEDSAGDQSSTETGAFDLRHPDSARVPVDPPPHNKSYYDAHFEALRRYWSKQTNGALELTWDIYPTEEDSAYHLSDVADYGPWWMSGFDVDILNLAERFVNDAFAVVDSSENPPDFRQYESFVIIHAGPDFQGDIYRDSPYDIPSFNVRLADPVAVQDSTFMITLIDVMPEHVVQDGFLGAINGVLTHEFGHQLGFFDLYNVYNFVPQVGMFSLHDSGDNLYGTVWDPYEEEEVYVRGAIPASLDPWQKMIHYPQGVNVHWVVEDEEIEQPPVQLRNDLTLVPIGGQGLGETGWSDPLHWIGSEYFIIENRPFDLNGDNTVYLKADSLTGVILGPRNVPDEDRIAQGLPPDTLGRFEQDFLLPGSGILIWHIDNVAIYDAARQCSGCVNVFDEHKSVDIEEADGIQDMGDRYSVQWTGGMHDYWYRGGYSHFGPETVPSSASASGANTGISIDVLDSTLVAMSNGEPGMRVKFERGFTREGWPRYAGYPTGNDGIMVSNLGDGGEDVIMLTGGEYFQIMGAEPATGGIIGEADSLMIPGIAYGYVDHFDDSRQTYDFFATASNTKVYLWEKYSQGGADRTAMIYPGGDEVFPMLRFTTAPMIIDSVVVVGDSEGRLRGLAPGDQAMVWQTAVPGYAVTKIAGGPILPEDEIAIVWGNEIGEIYLAAGSKAAGYELAAGWPVAVSGQTDPIVALLLIQGESSGDEGTIVAIDASGVLTMLSTTGEVVEGWPVNLGGVPAGSIAAGDPDGDGELELVIALSSGDIHLLDLEGMEEPTWPRSVWHPDVTWRAPILSGPSLLDMDGDGYPEILQGGGYGDIHAMKFDGGEIAGWPRVAGYTSISGPIVGRFGASSGLEIAALDRSGFAAIISTGLGDRDQYRGEMWDPIVDIGRGHCLTREMLPEPLIADGLLASEKMIFFPNPMEGGEGELMLDAMPVEGTVEIKLFDTSGQEAWSQTHDLTNRIPLDLRSIASGLYIAKITVEGEGEKVSKVQKIAVIH